MIFIGDKSVLNDEIRALMERIETESEKNDGTVVNMAINYGGRQEVTYACKEIAEKVKSGELNPEDITEDTISANIFTKAQPDPDLIIRPSGEYRLSNFLIWQSAYSEFWFDNVLWPDFTINDLNRALNDYANRQRRFGGVK